MKSNLRECPRDEFELEIILELPDNSNLETVNHTLYLSDKTSLSTSSEARSRPLNKEQPALIYKFQGHVVGIYNLEVEKGYIYQGNIDKLVKGTTIGDG